LLRLRIEIEIADVCDRARGTEDLVDQLLRPESLVVLYVEPGIRRALLRTEGTAEIRNHVPPKTDHQQDNERYPNPTENSDYSQPVHLFQLLHGG